MAVRVEMLKDLDYGEDDGLICEQCFFVDDMPPCICDDCEFPEYWTFKED